MKIGKRLFAVATALSVMLLSVFLTVEQASAQPLLVLDKQNYDVLEPIEAAFSNGPGNPTDWVGIYKPGEVPGNGTDYSTLWLYVNGTQTADVGLTDSYVTFDPGLAEAGDWWAGFFANDGYELLDSLAFTVGGGSGLRGDEPAALPGTFSLGNYPNPFNSETTISFNLPRDEEVCLKVIDIRGEVKAVLVQGAMSRGKHTIRFSAEGLASGVYYYMLQTGPRMISHNMLLLK
jgi:hypothetical protein